MLTKWQIETHRAMVLINLLHAQHHRFSHDPKQKVKSSRNSNTSVSSTFEKNNSNSDGGCP